MSLRKILGRSNRAKKSSSRNWNDSAGNVKRLSTSTSSSSCSSPAETPCRSSVPRPKPQVSKSNGSRSETSTRSNEWPNDGEVDFLDSDDKLDDCGIIHALNTDLSLRDVPQAVQHIRAHMFTDIPEQRSGLNSTRTAEVLNYRRYLAPLVTVPHIAAFLSSPSAVEREIAQLSREGFLRKVVVVRRRGEMAEAVLLTTDLERLIRNSPCLSEMTKSRFMDYLRENLGNQSLSMVNNFVLSACDINELFVAGFLTAHHMGTTSHSTTSSETATDLFASPEDRSTLMSIEMVSRQAAGSIEAVGGAGALDRARGTGSNGSRIPSNTTELRLAVPGHGAYLKLVSAALAQLVSLLRKARFHEMPEKLLQERWEGGVAQDAAWSAAKHVRGEFTGILPGQTRKWRQFHGLSFNWILCEAVGAGLVEVFQTGAVGRGIRAI